MRFIGIIPARYASTRFPGKPLALLGGKPVIQHVYEQARKALDEVVVATDDQRIYDAVEAFGGRAVMTREDHPCGTNRCLEAVRKTCASFGANDVVINVQGDEPFIQPEQIELLKSCFPTDIATLVKPFTEEDGPEALKNPNSPKVVVADGRALYFSRSVIPYLRGVEEKEWIRESIRRGTPYYKHIGMYAYRASVLEQLVALPQSPLEKTESLEQLRWLEAGYAIRVAVTDTQTIGIDTPEDLARAEAYLRSARFL
ncbi:MAG: 3-deoxy-manno-octulosonate cytidylyltransferase [Paludibacteraceae bacterium]|nr:3-deoxy-manno-octulosonate cytidylyltransferase [Paludibacteraceae bacterium]